MIEKNELIEELQKKLDCVFYSFLSCEKKLKIAMLALDLYANKQLWDVKTIPKQPNVEEFKGVVFRGSYELTKPWSVAKIALKEINEIKEIEW